MRVFLSPPDITQLVSYVVIFCYLLNCATLKEFVAVAVPYFKACL